MTGNVLITGGARGIGRSMTEAFLKAGCKVCFTYNRSIREAEELALAGHSDLLEQAKADSSITPEMFAVQLVKAEKAKKAKIQNSIAEDAADLKNVQVDSNLGFETADAKAQQAKQTQNEKDEQERDALVKAAAAQFNK